MCTIIPCIDYATTGGGKLAKISCSQSEALFCYRKGFTFATSGASKRLSVLLAHRARTAEVTAVDLCLRETPDTGPCRTRNTLRRP